MKFKFYILVTILILQLVGCKKDNSQTTTKIFAKDKLKDGEGLANYVGRINLDLKSLPGFGLLFIRGEDRSVRICAGALIGENLFLTHQDCNFINSSSDNNNEGAYVLIRTEKSRFLVKSSGILSSNSSDKNRFTIFKLDTMAPEGTPIYKINRIPLAENKSVQVPYYSISRDQRTGNTIINFQSTYCLVGSQNGSKSNPQIPLISMTENSSRQSNNNCINEDLLPGTPILDEKNAIRFISDHSIDEASDKNNTIVANLNCLEFAEGQDGCWDDPDGFSKYKETQKESLDKIIGNLKSQFLKNAKSDYKNLEIQEMQFENEDEFKKLQLSGALYNLSTYVLKFKPKIKCYHDQLEIAPSGSNPPKTPPSNEKEDEEDQDEAPATKKLSIPIFSEQIDFKITDQLTYDFELTTLPDQSTLEDISKFTKCP